MTLNVFSIFFICHNFQIHFLFLNYLFFFILFIIVFMWIACFYNSHIQLLELNLYYFNHNLNFLKIFTIFLQPNSQFFLYHFNQILIFHNLSPTQLSIFISQLQCFSKSQLLIFQFSIFLNHFFIIASENSLRKSISKGKIASGNSLKKTTTLLCHHNLASLVKYILVKIT